MPHTPTHSPTAPIHALLEAVDTDETGRAVELAAERDAYSLAATITVGGIMVHVLASTEGTIEIHADAPFRLPGTAEHALLYFQGDYILDVPVDSRYPVDRIRANGGE